MLPRNGTALALGLALASVGCSRVEQGDSRAAEAAVIGSAASAPSPTATRTAPSSVAAKTDGSALYARYCALCHGASAQGYAADNAPSLVTNTFLESASDAFIRRSIRMGRPGTAMAAYGAIRGGPLSEVDISRIVEFIRSFGPAYRAPPGPPGGNIERGAELFEKECKSCHGDETKRGNAVSLHNPELLASATPAFLHHAIVNGRAPTPMLPFKDRLSGEQIADVVSWLHSLAPTGPASAPVRETAIPNDLPIVINPKGKPPQFSLRENRYVSAAQVKQALDARQRLVLVDARSPADWIQYHIPGAISAAYHDTERLSRIPNDGTWVIAYCACPHRASGQVVDALRARGYRNTAVLDEGILVWRDRGYPLEGESVDRSAPQPKR
jgi:cytochrome c oxidase cbb3-type subunit 3/ubiquinol-cytochrome c reductase cytochrome c subunit